MASPLEALDLEAAAAGPATSRLSVWRGARRTALGPFPPPKLTCQTLVLAAVTPRVSAHPDGRARIGANIGPLVFCQS